MKAMILAAGRGERMRPLTDITPKPLLTVGGKPLIVWVIERLHRAGITDIVVNISHLAGQIREALGNGSPLGVHIAYSHETEALETAGGIAWALPLLNNQPFLVINSDVFSDYDLSRLVMKAQMLRPERPAHLVLVDNPPHHPLGDFGLSQGIIIHEPPKLTFSGIGAYHPALFASIPRGAKMRLAPQLAAPIAAGQVSGEHHLGEWNDVGTPQRLAALDANIMKRL